MTATDWLAANNNKSMKGGKLASNSKTLWLTTKLPKIQKKIRSATIGSCVYIKCSAKVAK